MHACMHAYACIQTDRWIIYTVYPHPPILHPWPTSPSRRLRRRGRSGASRDASGGALAASRSDAAGDEATAGGTGWIEGLVARPQPKDGKAPKFQAPKSDSNSHGFLQFFQCQPFMFQRFRRVSAWFRCYLRGHRQVQCDLVLRSSAMASAQRAQQWQQCAQVMQQFREEKNHGGRTG